MSRRLPIPNQALWVENISSQYESTWIALHRLLWLNDLNGRTLLRVLANSSQAMSPEHGHFYWQQRSFPSHNLFRAEASPFQGFDQIFRERQLQLPHSKQFSSRLGFRYCPACLDNGFHSSLYELDVVHECPIHSIPFLTNCLHCGKPPGEHGVTVTLWEKPMCCASCGTPFVPRSSMAQAVIDGYPAAALKLPAWRSRLLLLYDVELTATSRDRFSLQDVVIYRKFFQESLWRMTEPPEHDAPPLRPDWPFSEFPLKASVAWGKRPVLGACISGSFVLHCVKVAIRVIRSIDKQLSFRVRGICGHRAPATWYFDGAQRRLGRDFSLQMEGHHCPCCITLAWWRQQIGHVFGFYDRWHKDFDTRWDHEPWRDTQEALILDPRRLAIAAWSLFAVFASQMEAIVEESTEEAFIDESNEEEKSFLELYENVCGPLQILTDSFFSLQKKAGCVLLPLARDEVPAFFIELLYEGRRVAYAPSMNNALLALRRCDAVRRRQPVLWKTVTVWKGYPGRDKWSSTAHRHVNRYRVAGV